jgi:hypothetical protein
MGSGSNSGGGKQTYVWFGKVACACIQCDWGQQEVSRISGPWLGGLEQEPLNPRTNHGKIRIYIDSQFWPLLL